MENSAPISNNLEDELRGGDELTSTEDLKNKDDRKTVPQDPSAEKDTTEDVLHRGGGQEVLDHAEQDDDLVREAADESDLPKRDTDEFTDQHLKKPAIDPEIEDKVNDEEGN